MRGGRYGLWELLPYRYSNEEAFIDSVLADGAARAQVLAGETMRAVKDIVGFVRR